MREFLSYRNLLRASALAAIVTLMSIGRLIQGGMPLAIFVPLTFGVLTFICGAVTAWEHCAGMPGLVTDRRTLLHGSAVALVIAMVVLPLRLLWLDDIIRKALLSAGERSYYELSYPSTLGGVLALVMWSAGFQLLFTQAAPLSLCARLTNSRTISTALCVALHTYIMYTQVVAAGMTELPPLFILAALAQGLVACLVFGIYGLIPTVVLAIGTDLHLLSNIH
ncbi:MAG: hypothetical protein QGH42_12180 [Kiritimatiellia bacterium]|jgi:hypothetical protein|nr:hypothetical protein [Kiritimatiellia bacterium]MDP6810499.1 hypothetical protein [Kiritimatiellia bacterium]MDP7024983.1 hypothetical protein [Kiritimatiellia bacterium]